MKVWSVIACWGRKVEVGWGGREGARVAHDCTRRELSSRIDEEKG
jgi:hypothetical protein